MKIIGHRGAAGAAPENTIEGIKAAYKQRADLIEIDVRQTADNQIVLQHDKNMIRTESMDIDINEYDLKNLRLIHPNIATLKNALKANKTKGAIIEIKEDIKPYKLLQVTDMFPKQDIRFASFDPAIIKKIKRYSPASFCYLLEHHNPIEVINYAKKIKADGIGINISLLNPLTYWLAHKKGLQIYTYTVNHKFIAKLLSIFYKEVDICTDYPKKIKEVIN